MLLLVRFYSLLFYPYLEKNGKGQMSKERWRLLTCPPRGKMEKRKQRASKVLGYEFLLCFFSQKGSEMR